MQITIESGGTQIYQEIVEKTQAQIAKEQKEAEAEAKKAQQQNALQDFQQVLSGAVEQKKAQQQLPDYVPQGYEASASESKTEQAADTLSSLYADSIKTASETKASEPAYTETNPTAALPAQNDADFRNGEKIAAPDSLKGIFEKAADLYDIDEALLTAVAYHESRFQSNCVSSAGAIGVMQLMPGTAFEMDVHDPYDPEQNIMGAAKLISYLRDVYNGDMTLAMAAYATGEGTVRRAGYTVPSQAQEFISFLNDVVPNHVDV